MHILYISAGDTKYGAARSLRGLITRMITDRDVKITLALPCGPDGEDIAGWGCRTVFARYSSFMVCRPSDPFRAAAKYFIKLFPYMLGRVRAVSDMERAVDLSRVDIVHCNTASEDLGAMISARYGIPLIWHIREYGDLDHNWYSYRHDPVTYMNDNARRFIMISESVRDHWISKGIDPDKCTVIYNGVSQDVPYKEDYKKSKDPLKMVIVGSVLETKGQHIIVEALDHLNRNGHADFLLDIIGDGPKRYTDMLKKKISASGLEKKIRLLGYMENPCSRFPGYDCALMCSRSEAFGRVTAEYMMAGLPVIASASGANPELVRDGINGMLFDRNDHVDLAGRIHSLMDNRDMLEVMGKNARAAALGRFTADRNAEEIMALYETVLKERR